MFLILSDTQSEVFSSASIGLI